MRCSAPSRARRSRSTRPLLRACARRPRARAWGLAGALTLGVGTGSLAGAREAAAGPPPQLDDEAEVRSNNGAILLSWDAELGVGEREYELQEAGDPGFEDAVVRYRGSFPSWFLSGRLDGTRYFRVRSRSWSGSEPEAWSEWSATKVVIVEHHDLQTALLLFGFGATVFLATCVTLLLGAREGAR